jgi:hypothetical protein
MEMAYVVFCEQIVILGLSMVENVVVKRRIILSQTLRLHKGGSLLSTFCVGW